MDLFHKIMELVDKNSESIPEGDYLQLCDTIQELREHVKPPSFLDQTTPMWVSDETSQGPPVYQPTITDGQPPEWMDDNLPSDPDTVAQRDREQLHQRWRELDDDEERENPGLRDFVRQLDADWAATDNIGPVEPGAYYPPPRQSMQDGTTVAEVMMMDVD